ncbi:MAG: hypothetical protein Q7U93_07200 [Nitrosomonas sp.]|nr:hypothetical protein [Nitrosomonas sp.]MDO8894738.1 hypothetical protein [Nitrosomonas sp.]
MITIAEMPEYIRQAEKILTEAERQDVMNYLATLQSGRFDRRHRWNSQVALGQERTRQVWRSAGNLLLPQRVNAALFANVVHQEQAGQFEQS